jgi:two-component system NtrC family sensor kinase
VQERQLLDAMISGADQLSRSIASATWHAMNADHREAAYQIMQTIAGNPGIDRIRIFNKEGRVMFSTVADDERQVDKRAEACYMCHASDQPLVRLETPERSRVFTGPDGRRKLAMVTPIYNEPSCSEADCHAHPRDISVLGVLDVSLGLDRVDAELAAVRENVMLTTGLHVVLVGILIVLFTRRFVDRPIEELIVGTQAVSQMKLEEPLTLPRSGELGALARSFETMRVRLKEAVDENSNFTQRLETRVQQRTQQLEVAHQRLVQTDRLASLGQLSASVAHEINNPLSGVLNLAVLIQRIVGERGIPPERLPEVKRYLEQISHETARVGKIVSDLLAFSRRTTSHRVQGDLHHIVASLVTIIGHKFELMGVALEIKFPDRLPPIPCDPSQIQQVLVNLLMNAAEASAGKPSANVQLEAEADEPGQRITIRVHDNGEGMTAELASKIFDPFFTTKGEGKGVGLGLAVVYGIIEAHRGTIDVESAVGKGTTVTVTLPLVDAQSRPEPVDAEPTTG